jgi:hypothetical protein
MVELATDPPEKTEALGLIFWTAKYRVVTQQFKLFTYRVEAVATAHLQSRNLPAETARNKVA